MFSPNNTDQQRFLTWHMDYEMFSSGFRRPDGSDFAQFKRGNLVPEVYGISRDFEERVSNSSKVIGIQNLTRYRAPT